MENNTIHFQSFRDCIQSTLLITKNTSIKYRKLSARAVSNNNMNYPVKSKSGEEIVISGISGKFPLSDNMNSFRENLFGQIDMVTSDNRWDVFYLDLPERIGKVNHTEKFDFGFFGIHRKEANAIDSMCRGLMEKVFEAIFDAGVNPKEIEGTKTGVYIAASSSECQGQMKRKYISLLPNRISYALKVNGPSCAVDTGCSSSLFALHEAYVDIMSGKIDAAIVGTTVLNLQHPFSTLQYAKLGVLSPDGVCKTFDANANGYVRSETISAILLQKSKHARRIYSKIIHCKVGCDGYKTSGIVHPSEDGQKQLLRDFYEECNINPATIDYIETHGTGTYIGDLHEAEVVDDVFAKKRLFPLLLGSVKSNMGHAEPGSALCQIAKAVITMENGSIPPNLHFKTARKDMSGFKEGRLQVVCDITPFPGITGLIAIQSLGVGGANGHALLKWNEKTKLYARKSEDSAPRIICVSGRIKRSVELFFQQLKCTVEIDEFVALLHQLFKYDIPQHPYTGFMIITKTGEIFKSITRKCLRKPDFFLIFGNASKDSFKYYLELLDLPMARCIYEVIEQVLHREKLSGIGNIRNELSIVLLTVTVQIIIFEILRACKLVPKTIKGVGYGKFVERFAMGELSLEECVLAAYSMAKRCEYKQQKSSNTDKFNDTKEIECVALYTSLNKNINLLSNNKQNILFSLLKAIGRLYILGYNPQLQEIYPKNDFPVSRGTPMISPLIQWNHEQNWLVDIHHKDDGCCKRVFSVNISDNEWKFIADHSIDGPERTLFPASGYLYIVWETFSTMMGRLGVDMEILFENIRFERATHIPKNGKVEFLVSITKKSGLFEIFESGVCIVNGKVGKGKRYYNEIITTNALDENVLNEEDIYKELRLRGYNYSGLFKSIRYCTSDFKTAFVQWHKNWIAFIDNILQLQLLNIRRGLFVVVFIKKLAIDARYHLNFVNEQKDSILPVNYYKEINMLKSGGIEIVGMKASAISRRKPLKEPLLEKYVFVPYEAFLSLEDSIRVIVQIILENTYIIKFKSVEIVLEGTDTLTPLVRKAVADNPQTEVEAVIIQNNEKAIINDCLLAIGVNLLQNTSLLENALQLISEEGFVLSRETSSTNIENEAIKVVSVLTTSSENLILVKKRHVMKLPKIVSIDNPYWIKSLQRCIKSKNEILIISQKDPFSGIIGLVNCIRKEPQGKNYKCVFIQDESAPDFNLKLEFYRKQLSKGLAMNVFRNGQWGTYRHLPLKPELTSEKKHAFIEGNLSSLQWIEGPLSVDDDCVIVHYAALNFKDVMTASGRLQYTTNSGFDESDFLYGLEYSGRDSSGRRVMGVLQGGALSTRIRANKNLLIQVPDEWSLEEAATIPVVYLTTLHALIEVRRIRLLSFYVLLVFTFQKVFNIEALVAFHYLVLIETGKQKLKFKNRRKQNTWKNFIRASRYIYLAVLDAVCSHITDRENISVYKKFFRFSNCVW